MEGITVADYAHGKRVCKYFEINNLGEYYDFYVQKDILLLADAFGNFKNMCINIYELVLQNFFQLQGYHGKQLLKSLK